MKQTKLVKNLLKNNQSTFGNDLSQVPVIFCTCTIHDGRPAASPSSFCSPGSRS
jgi:hypothetical protein